VRLICGIKFYLLTYTAVIALHRIVLAEADPAHHPSLLLPLRATAEGPKSEAQRADSGVGSLGRGASPFPTS